MHLSVFRPNPCILSLFILSLPLTLVTASSPLSADIFYWPLSAPQPSRLAQITYDPSTSEATILSYTPPLTDSRDRQDDDLIRVGLYTASPANPKYWVGSITSLSSFSDSIPTLSLSLGPRNEIYHVSLSFTCLLPTSSSGAGKPGSQSEANGASQLDLKLVHLSPGPSPFLNRPIVLSPDGKGAEEVVEKTLFQKYWWVLLILMFLVMSGGGDGN